MTELVFGVNVSASATPGADPVQEARRAEQAGFDFVSANDHPGSERACLELWTMMSWIAASTTRISVLSRVLAAPLRLPAMVAKAAESLDRLSGGRLILGLGAGSADEELVGFGAPPLSAAEKITGLGEAIEIIQGMWSQPQFTYDGSIFRTVSAVLQPKPSRKIPIWIGAFGPRALSVTGRFADGWIPSLGYGSVSELAAMRMRVLSAAADAGRDADAVKCVLNAEVSLDESHPRGDGVLVGSPDRVAREVLGLVESGFTGFNFVPIGDRIADQVIQLGEEVLPRVRDWASSSSATNATPPAANDEMEGGDPACWAHLLCPECGAVLEGEQHIHVGRAT